jgi:hypothetical protein
MQERPFSSISIQRNTLRENYVPFHGSTLRKQPTFHPENLGNPGDSPLLRVAKNAATVNIRQPSRVMNAAT